MKRISRDPPKVEFQVKFLDGTPVRVSRAGENRLYKNYDVILGDNSLGGSYPSLQFSYGQDTSELDSLENGVKRDHLLITSTVSSTLRDCRPLPAKEGVSGSTPDVDATFAPACGIRTLAFEAGCRVFDSLSGRQVYSCRSARCASWLLTSGS